MVTWAQRIADLEARSWSLTKIAAEVGASTSAMSDIKQGRTKEPRASVAMALHALHARVMAEPAPDREAA